MANAAQKNDTDTIEEGGQLELLTGRQTAAILIAAVQR